MCQRALCSCIQGRGRGAGSGAGAAGRQAGIRGQRAGNPFGRIKGESAVTVTGIVSPEPRAPHGVEIRLTEIKVLSTPAEVLPIAVSKWKLNTSLETKLALRPITLRNPMERAKFRIQEGIVRGFRDFLHSQGFYRDSHTEDRGPRRRGGSMCSVSITLTRRQSWGRARSFTSRPWSASMTGYSRRLRVPG